MNINYEDAIMNPNDVLKELMRRRATYLSMIPEIKQGTGKDKRWTVYLRDKDNKRKIIRKNTKEEVQEAALQCLMRWDRNESTITVGDYWEKWYNFKLDHNRNLKSMSKTKFVSDRKKFLDGTAFAEMPIQKVKAKDIEDYLCEQVKANDLSVKRTCQLAGYIRGIFKVAYRDEVIKNEVWPKVDLQNIVYPCCIRKRTVKDSDKILSDTQIYKIKKAIKDHLVKHPDYILDYGILIALNTGMRAGELVALRWDHISNACIYVTDSERRISNGDGTQSYEIGPTKNYKERKVPISSDLAYVLDELRSYYKEKEIDSPYVLYTEKGRPNAGSLEKDATRRGKDAEIEGGLTIHRIRRTVASRLNRVFDRATVSHILGHTEEVDLNHYDFDTEKEEEVIQVMNHLYA